MKKFFRILTATALVAAMILSAGCQKKETSGDRLENIKAAGKITIALEGAWAPWNYHDEEDVLVGFDTEVGQMIAEKLGVEAEFVESDWDSLLAGLESGRYDLMINGVEYTEERAKKYDFSTPYAYIHTALIVSADNEDITCFEDLNGKTTANSIQSTYMLLAEEYGANVEGVDTLEETLNLVLAGRVDATLNSEDSYYDYMKAHPDAALKVAATTEEASHVCIPMPKGDDSASLKEAVDQALEELRAEGKLSEVSLKYFGRDITNE